MNILDAIVNAQDGAAVQQLGSQVGLAPDQATAALSALMPALAGGFQRNIQSQGGLESLMAALSSGNHGQHRQPHEPRRSIGSDRWKRHSWAPVGEQGREPRGRQSGGGANRTERRRPETHAAARRHVDDGRILEAAGPRVLTTAALGGSGGGIAAMLTPFLDQNRDGSIIDDVTSTIKLWLPEGRDGVARARGEFNVGGQAVRGQRTIGRQMVTFVLDDSPGQSVVEVRHGYERHVRIRDSDREGQVPRQRRGARRQAAFQGHGRHRSREERDLDGDQDDPDLAEGRRR